MPIFLNAKHFYSSTSIVKLALAIKVFDTKVLT